MGPASPPVPFLGMQGREGEGLSVTAPQWERGEGTRKPQSVSQPMATVPDFHGVLQTTPKGAGMNQPGKAGA